MKKRLLAGLVLAVFGLMPACDDGKGEKKPIGNDTGATADVAPQPDQVGDLPLPACPDETILTGFLPCDCYGNVATDPDAQVPGCKTQVVCCPAIQNLRCEDHELLEPGLEIIEDLATELVPDSEPLPEVVEELPRIPEETVDVPDCPFEVHLAPYTPCLCKGTLVEDVAQAMPTCTKKVVCCPFGGLKCE